MLETILKLLANETFWLGLCIGYVLACIVCFIVELLCVMTDKKEIDKWMVEE